MPPFFSRAPRVAVVLLALAACSRHETRTRTTARDGLPAESWAMRCAERIEVARRALLPRIPSLERAELRIDRRAWHPSVRFEAHTAAGGYYVGAVTRGPDPCVCIDPPRRERDEGWTRGRTRSMLARVRAHDYDRAWIHADRVPIDTLAPFAEQFERTLGSCFEEPIALSEAPPGACTDGTDPPDEAAEILDELNAWCSNQGDECEISESRDAGSERDPSGETNGWIAAHRRQLRRYGFDAAFDARTKRFVLRPLDRER